MISSLPAGAGAATGPDTPGSMAQAVLAGAFEASAVPMAVLGPDGDAVLANAAWRCLGGVPAPPTVEGLLHPADRTACRRALTGLRAGSALHHRARWQLARTGGTARWVDATLTPVPGTGGAPDLVHAAFLDVTEEVLAAHATAESERHHRQLVQLAAEGIWMLDRDWVIRFANQAMADMLGRRVPDLVGRPLTDFLDAEGCARALRDRRRREQGVTEVVQNSLLHADGHVVWVRVNATPTRDEHGRISGSLAVLSDITRERAMERALAEREHRYALLVEHLPGSAVLVLDRALRIITAGGGALGSAGFTPAELIGRTITEILPAPDARFLAPKLAEAVAGRPSGTFEYHHSPSGRIALIDAVPLTRDEHGVSQILIATRDVTDLKDAEAQLAHLADHDPLTGLLNRRGFTAALARHAALVRRYGSAGALLMIDVDHFKRVNDTFGHTCGDAVIVTVADLLRETLRDTDVAARLGGDEFAVLLARGGRAEAEAVAERILLAARSAARPVTLSLGVAMFDDPSVGGDSVLVNADRAMYDAKAAGRDRYDVYGAVRA